MALSRSEVAYAAKSETVHFVFEALHFFELLVSQFQGDTFLIPNCQILKAVDCPKTLLLCVKAPFVNQLI